MEKIRAKEREASLVQSWTNGPTGVDFRILDTIESPTVERLASLAENIPIDRFYLLKGVIPVAAGTVFARRAVVQQSHSTGEWILLGQAAVFDAAAEEKHMREIYGEDYDKMKNANRT